MCRRPAQKGAVLRKRPLQSAGADRTNDGQDQALQTYRATLREDGNKLCLIPRTRLRIHLDQIRPHGLAQKMVDEAMAKARKLGIAENVAILDDGGNLKAFSRMVGPRSF